jgi:hypothetical protein
MSDVTTVAPTTPTASETIAVPKTRYEERVEASREERKRIVEEATPKSEETKKNAKEKSEKPRALRELEEELGREIEEAQEPETSSGESEEDSEVETESESEELREDEAEKKTEKKDRSRDDHDRDTEKSDFHKLKVDGEEKEVTYDKLKELAQKGFAADKRFQQAAAREKQVDRFFEALKDDPLRVLMHPSLGINLEELSERVLWQKIAPQVMGEKEWEAERQAEQDRQDLARLRKKEEKEREQRRAATEKAEAEKKNAEKAENVKRWTTAIDAALKDAKVPVTAWSRSRTAAYLKQEIAAGNKSVTPADLASKVKEDWASEQRHAFSQLDDDELENFLGRDIGERLRKRDLEKFKKDEKKEARRARKEPSERTSGETFSSVSELMRSLK